MKCIIRDYGYKKSQADRYAARAEARDITLTRGTSRVPYPPRGVMCQSAPRGLLVTWNLPAGYNADIQRWRVYKNDENTLYQEIADRGTRQCFVETTAGSSPPVVNVFVSSLSNLGVESSKTPAQGEALTESGAPAMPNPPPGYNDGAAGGGNTGGGYGGRGGTK